MEATGDKHEKRQVDAARAGDVDAVAWLYERYCNRIYSYVFAKLGDRSAAEDVTSHVFLKMVEKIDAFNWQGSGFAAWLFRIAHNQIIDAQRKKSRHNQVSIDEPGIVLPSRNTMPGTNPEEYVERGEMLSQLRSCISQLSDLQAQVILLKYAAELSNIEIAEVMSRTTNAVSSLHYEATRKLGKLLADEGYGAGR